MPNILHRSQITLISNPYWRRVGLTPMCLTLAVSWIFMVLWFFTAIWLLQYQVLFALAIMCSTILFSVFLSIMTRKLIVDGRRDYTLELTEDEAVLSTTDRHIKKTVTRMVLLEDVKYAEYYPFCDCASVILHAPYIDLEIPLWPLEGQGRDAIDFLKGRGVPVVNVQSDDKIPD